MTMIAARGASTGSSSKYHRQVALELLQNDHRYRIPKQADQTTIIHIYRQLDLFCALTAPSNVRHKDARKLLLSHMVLLFWTESSVHQHGGPSRY
jgi:hypothetical protein